MCTWPAPPRTAGFESIWTVDHVVVPAGYRSTYPYDPSGRLPSGEDAPFPDPLIWLAYVARETSTIRLATGILILPERNPVVLAKELATLDYLSSGRVTLGVGIGWMKEEFEALGVPFEGRGARMEESIAAMRALWTQERASLRGLDVSFRDVYPAAPARRAARSRSTSAATARSAARRAGRIGRRVLPLRRRTGRALVLLGDHHAAGGGGRRARPVVGRGHRQQLPPLDADEAVAEARELEELGVDPGRHPGGPVPPRTRTARSAGSASG